MRMKHSKGFVLPMIVVTGLVLMIIMAFTLQTISISRENLINQRAQLLARQAAESGLARARQCMQQSNQIVTWTETNPLKPNTDCHGAKVHGLSGYVANNDLYRSYFEVRPSDITDEFRNASSVGKVDILRKSSSSGVLSVVRVHSHTASTYIRTGLSFDDIAFGSTFLKVVEGTAANVYFQTKSIAGLVSGAGQNYRGSVLTGVPETELDPSLNPKTHLGKTYENGVNLPVSELPSKVMRLITNFQGSGWNTYLLLHDGSVYVTGPGYHGHKGNGLVKTHSKWPSESKMNLYDDTIGQNIAVKDIVGGGAYTFILSQDNKLYGMGADFHSYNSPLHGYGVIGCYRHAHCRFDNHAGRDIFNPQWGSYRARLFNGPARWVIKPTRVSTKNKDLENVSVVSADILYNMAEITSCAIGNDDKTSADRKVYCWGSNERGQIADVGSNNIPGYSPGSIPYAYEIYDDQSDKPIDVKTDGSTVYVLTEKGKVFARGNNIFRQIGPHDGGVCYGRAYGYWCELQEIKIPGGVKIKKMIADSFFALFLDEAGDVWGMGHNGVGQLGNGRSDTSNYPRKVIFPAGIKIADFTVASPGTIESRYNPDSYRNSLFIDTNGDVWGAGSNKYGQLGIGDNANQDRIRKLCPDVYDRNMRNRGVLGRESVDIPVKMCLAREKHDGTIEEHKAKVGGVKVGLGTAVIITNKNKVFTVGNNHQGQLGAGDNISRSIPEAHRLTNRWDVYYY